MKNIQIGYPLLEEECEKESHRRIKKRIIILQIK